MVSSYDTVIFKLPGYHSTGSNNTAVTEYSSLEDDGITTDETIHANADWAGRYKVAISTIGISQELYSLFYLNRVEVVIKDLHIPADGSVVADLYAFPCVDRSSANSALFPIWI